MVRAKTYPHAKSGHGMKLIVSPVAYIDSGRFSWPTLRLVYKPTLDKQMIDPQEVVIQRHNL